MAENNRRDLAETTRLQREGQISTHFEAIELLTLAPMWMSQTPELTAALRRKSRTRRRTVVVDAVRAILAAR